MLFLLNAGVSEASFINGDGGSWGGAGSVVTSGAGVTSGAESRDGDQDPTDIENRGDDQSDSNASESSMLSLNSFKSTGSMGGNSAGAQDGGQSSLCGLFHGDAAVRLQAIGWLRCARLARFIPPLAMTLLRPPR
ncbi:MAG: hypothetical protein EXS05_20570 [Planctomycetaceae bacterium]|nr:hypothetical protein [Planctomycetaceae bacterium]